MEKLIEFARKSEEEILTEFKTTKEGLNEKEAEERLKKFGLNKIVYFKIDIVEIIKRNSFNFFNVFLFFAGLLSFLIKGPEIETILIFFFLLLSILVAIFQDYRVNKLSEKLLSYFKNYAWVKRNGKWQKIEAEYLVPGDYVKVQAGYLIPADIRILKSEESLVDESIITGESEPIYKTAERTELTQNSQKDSASSVSVPHSSVLNSASSASVQGSSALNSASSASVLHDSVIPENIALLGTTLIKGEIEGIVFATGKESYFGSIAKKTIEISKETAYQKMMDQFAKNIALIAIFIALTIILINLLKPGYHNFQELIIFSIILAIAIVPEFLPTMTVLTLSLAGVKLAKRGLIIKRLSSIEDLGAVEILCTDKTGTITTNELKLERIITQNSTELMQHSQKNMQNYTELTQNLQNNAEKTEPTQNLQKNSESSASSASFQRDSVLNSASSASVQRDSAFIKYFLLDYYFTQEATPYEKAILAKIKELPDYSNFELIEDIYFDPVKRIRKVIAKTTDIRGLNADFENTRINAENYPRESVCESNPHESAVIEIIKGAPENVLDYCFLKTQNHAELTQNWQNYADYTQTNVGNNNKIQTNAKLDEEYKKWVKVFEEEDKKGLRTLGLGIRIYSNQHGTNGTNTEHAEQTETTRNEWNQRRMDGINRKYNSVPSENSVSLSENSASSVSISDSSTYSVSSSDSSANSALVLRYSAFLGIASFVDPLKETAFSAINLAQRLNLEIKILTGDSLNVARSVGLKLGLINENEKVVLGEEIRNLNEEELRKIVKETKIFARVLPEDKLKIIEVLQKEKFVGFLGEGINDAPALKIANVALAVDNATDVVKQEADIILKEKDLKTIVDGIYQGRKVLENIGKYIKHTMSDNFGNLTSVAILTLILPFVPMTTLQVLLTNFLTDIPLIAFANDNVEIKEAKRAVKMSNYHLILLLLGLGLVAGIINIIGYLIVRQQSIEVIRTYIFFLTTMTGLIVSFLIRTKNWFFLSKPNKSFMVASLIGLILTIIFVFLSPFNKIFEFASINHNLLLLSFLLMFFFVLGTEIIKKMFYKKFPDVI
ncbi:MAG: hypothetical protein KatS3mg095_0801 [Candidatus Parcubacteria bacterium]|nr:MAG: hypothetical protein KatS3mg095_0801 [Candidatus Parcubacteria bacterium]